MCSCAAGPALVTQVQSSCSLAATILGGGLAAGQAAGRWAELGLEAGPPVAFTGRGVGVG